MATKKASGKDTSPPKVSKIVKAAEAAIKRNPKRQGLSAAVAVISELKKQANEKVAILKFLDAALAEVKIGGGHTGDDKADPNGPSIDKPNG